MTRLAPKRGNVAQQIFWYTAFTADMSKPGLPVVNANGTPKWRMAPRPHGSVLAGGHEARLSGRQLVNAAGIHAAGTAQFTVSKTVSLKKTLVGMTPIHESNIRSQAMTKAAPRHDDLAGFYCSPARVAWTPTGVNVPDYPKLAQLWWPNVAAAVTGEMSPQRRSTRSPSSRTKC